MYKRIVAILFFTYINHSLALWCYECVSTQPGCGEPLNWLWHWTRICPEDNDVCVKLIEEKGSERVVTRSCLSSMQGLRKDIPADTYEGCRPASVDVKLGNYVNNSVKELDIYRNYYDKTTWCFCFLDHRCNDGALNSPSFLVFSFGIVLALYTILL